MLRAGRRLHVLGIYTALGGRHGGRPRLDCFGAGCLRYLAALQTIGGRLSVWRHHHSDVSHASLGCAYRFPAAFYVALHSNHCCAGTDIAQRHLDSPQYAGVPWQDFQSQQLRMDIMSGNFVRNAFSAAALALAVGAGAPAVAQEEPLKVGFVYVSPIGEAGWSWQQEVGRREMVEALGDKVVTQYVEDVPEGADAERVIRDLAQQEIGRASCRERV